MGKSVRFESILELSMVTNFLLFQSVSYYMVGAGSVVKL